MSDEKVLEFAGDHLPDAVRREMERHKREKETGPLTEEESPAGPELEVESPLPTPGDPYKAYSRPANKMVPTLNVLAGDGRRLGFQYSSFIEGPHWLPDEAGAGEIIVVRLNVGVVAELRLFGHNLGEMHVYLGDHRIRWVREVSKGRIIRPGGVPVITSFKIEQAQGWPPLGVG